MARISAGQRAGRKFSIAFGAACWRYFFYADQRRNLSIAFDDCPLKCGHSGEWDIKRKSFCETCPQKGAQESYLDDDSRGGAGLKQILQQRMKREGAKYDTARLFGLVLEVAATEDTPPGRMSAKGRKLLNIFLSERHKYDRYKDAQKPKN